MKDNFDKYVQDNQEKFDDLEPREKVWTEIDSVLQKEAKPNLNWLWKVAAMLFFATTILLFANSQWIENSDGLLVKKDKITRDFNDIETYYFGLISQKKSLIYDYESDELSVDQDFEQDLQKLDAMYQVLKEELKGNPSKQVVDALILNLLVRIDILNEQLQELDVNSSEEEKPENQINV